MSSVSPLQSSMLHARAAAAMTLLAGACFAVILTLAFTESPLAATALAFLLGALGMLTLVLGYTGAVAMGAVLSAFLLMARYDEGWALPVDPIIKLKISYLVTTGCAFALVAGAAVRPVFGLAGNRPVEGRAQRRLAHVLFGFALIALALNHATDTTVPLRNFKGEILALLAILIPLTFVWLIPRSPIAMGRALLCLRAIILLGGLAGLIMGMFGLLPVAVLNLLGWSTTTGGTADLVRGRLPLGHPNTVSAIMLLLLPPAIVFGFADRSILWRAVNLVCAVSMFGGTLFALSRAAFAAMLLALCVTFLYLVLTQRKHKVVVLLLLACVACVFAGIAAFLFTHMDFSRFWSRGYYEDASVDRRFESLTTVLAVWKDHPLLGVSPDAVYPRLDLRPDWAPPAGDIASPIIFYRGMPSAETPHNMYLSALAEFGTPGGIIFLAIIGVTLLQLHRVQRRLPDRARRRIVVGFMLGIGAFLLMGCFEALLMTSMRAATIFWVFAGLALRYAIASVTEDAELMATAPPALRPTLTVSGS